MYWLLSFLSSREATLPTTFSMSSFTTSFTYGLCGCLSTSLSSWFFSFRLPAWPSLFPVFSLAFGWAATGKIEGARVRYECTTREEKWTATGPCARKIEGGQGGLFPWLIHGGRLSWTVMKLKRGKYATLERLLEQISNCSYKKDNWIRAISKEGKYLNCSTTWAKEHFIGLLTWAEVHLLYLDSQHIIYPSTSMDACRASIHLSYKPYFFIPASSVFLSQ